ncbi:C2 family cysteine protease, partial [Streptomyces sp. P17]
LFGATGVLSYTQVSQGDVGDCYFEAALAGLAQQDPSLIKNMITVNSNGTYTVDFAGANGTRDYVTVNSDLAYMNGYRYASGSTLM